MTEAQQPDWPGRARMAAARVAAALMLGGGSAGCDAGFLSPERGAARIVLFKECMELAAKMPRQSDDDVSKIVDACSTQSFYMTRYAK